jgi:uncharacterized protein YwlG (UPF0340 family)
MAQCSRLVEQKSQTYSAFQQPNNPVVVEQLVAEEIATIKSNHSQMFSKLVTVLLKIYDFSIQYT